MTDTPNPTAEDLIEAYGMSGEGADFKRVYWAQREAARALLDSISGGAPSEVYPDMEGLTAAVFERSHKPPLSDDSRGVQEAEAFSQSLVDQYIDQRATEGAPFEEQVERAVRAAYPNTDFSDPELKELCDGYRKRIRRALTTAGVAPQEEAWPPFGTAERLALIEQCVQALSRSCVNETAAWSLWDVLASDTGPIRRALLGAWRISPQGPSEGRCASCGGADARTRETLNYELTRLRHVRDTMNAVATSLRGQYASDSRAAYFMRQIEEALEAVPPAPLDHEKVAEELMGHEFNALGQCTCGYATPDYGSGDRLRIEEKRHFVDAICGAHTEARLT